jgi:hypothetical protein
MAGEGLSPQLITSRTLMRQRVKLAAAFVLRKPL